MAHPEPLRTTIIVRAVCLVVGVAGGWWLRGDAVPAAGAVESAMPAQKPATFSETPAAVHVASPDRDSMPDASDFRTAIHAAIDDRDPFSRGIRLRKIIRDLRSADLPAAVATAAQLSDDEQSEICKLLGARWGETDPCAGLTFAESTRKNIQRTLIESIAARWAAINLTAAVAWFNAKPGNGTRQAAFSNVIAELGNRDPVVAAQFLAKMPVGDKRYAATHTLLREWMESDSAAAVAWVRQLPEGEPRLRALGSMMGFWVQRDGKAALDWLLLDPTTASPSSLLGQCVEDWAELSPDAAVAWASGQTDVINRYVALRAAVKGLSAIDPGKAVTVLKNDAQIGSDPTVHGQIAELWATEDPTAAAHWAQELPQGSGRVNAVVGVTQQWARIDSVGAAQWLKHLPEGKDRETAIEVFTIAVAGRDPNSAIELIKTVRNASSRDSDFDFLVRGWQRMDPAAATQWIRTTDQLSEESKSWFLKPD